MWTLIDLKASYDITNSYFTMFNAPHHTQSGLGIHAQATNLQEDQTQNLHGRPLLVYGSSTFTCHKPTYMNVVLVAVTSR
jgi:hypothetical protein